MAQFGELDVRLEPWDVEYGSEFPLDAPEDVGAAEVSLDVETPAGSWDSIEPAPATIPGRIIFVDGVRRLEARIILRRNAKLCRGAFGSYAVGAVLATHGDATIREVRADRVIVVGSGEFLPEPIRLMRFAPALAYRPLSVASQDVDAPLRGILDQMRLAEERLARELADEENTLVVADGPLTFGDPLRGGAVGYIKRLQKLYIPEDKLDLLSRLPPGSRTPLFGLRSSKRFARYAWFLRLVAPHPGESELSGLVRLEVSESVGVQTAKELADATAHTLPKFAPGRSRDPRAPQNLLPIGALESHLRRHLGDGRLIRRHIQTLLALN
jgi:hypothetical protein